MTDNHKTYSITVSELFAGAGGFRLGLEGYKKHSATSGYKRKFRPRFKVIWSNQFEPSTSVQHASTIYTKHFGDKGHVNKDINQVPSRDIPSHVLMVAGFPCQDFSIANRRSGTHGLDGKKGVLWWQIYRILEAKIMRGMPTPYLLFENVNRLLTSRNGKDFHAILSSLNRLGYAVEWRNINAAKYGFPQRRKRVFFVAYHKSSILYTTVAATPPKQWLTETGIIAKAFPVEKKQIGFRSFHLYNVQFTKEKKLFANAGMIVDGHVTTITVQPDHTGPSTTLASVLQDEASIDEKYYIANERLHKWRYYKGAKDEIKKRRSDGASYRYKEAATTFPDRLDRPARTIITSEGESSASRTTHVIETSSKRYRRLTPVELERLNMFPDDYTAGLTNPQRGFLMGNALVVGIVERIGRELSKRICA